MSLAFFGIFLATCLWQILSLLLTLARGQMDHQMLFEVKLLDCCRLYHMFGVSALSLSRLCFTKPNPTRLPMQSLCDRIDDRIPFFPNENLTLRYHVNLG